MKKLFTNLGTLSLLVPFTITSVSCSEDENTKSSNIIDNKSFDFTKDENKY